MKEQEHKGELSGRSNLKLKTCVWYEGPVTFNLTNKVHMSQRNIHCDVHVTRQRRVDKCDFKTCWMDFPEAQMERSRFIFVLFHPSGSPATFGRV